MGRFRELGQDEIERLFAGRAPSGEGLEDVAAFATALREQLHQGPEPALRARHLQAIAEAARLAAPEWERDQAARRVRPAQAWMRRRKKMLGTILGSLAAKIAVAATAAAAATGGLAATGNLPAPAQSVVASAVVHVGVHIPTPAPARHKDQKVSKPDDVGSPRPSEHPDNHGGDVSSVAHSASPGPGHGATVSDTASTNSDSHRQDGEHKVPSPGPTAHPTPGTDRGDGRGAEHSSGRR